MPVSITGDARLAAAIAEHPYPLLFATVSGAHLYGFPSPDSDYDLRGVHLLPPEALLGLEVRDETVSAMAMRDGVEIDLVSHDARKFFQMLLKRNGYVMEQLFSPLVVEAGPELEELRAIAKTCLTRHHAHHYLGFAATQWKLFEKETPHRVKPLLYTFRVLLTGIHLMRTGEIEANLVTLNEDFKLAYLPELIARKLEGPEKGTLDAGEVTDFRKEVERLTGELEAAMAASPLPEAPAGREALNALLLRLRLDRPAAH